MDVERQTFFALKSYQFDKAALHLDQIDDPDLLYVLSIIDRLWYFAGQESFEYCYDLEIDEFSNEYRCYYYIATGLNLLYHQGNNAEAFQYLNKAYTCQDQISREFDKFVLLCILEFYQFEFNQTNVDFEEYLSELDERSSDLYDAFWVGYHKILFRFKNLDSTFWETSELFESFKIATDKVPEYSKLHLFYFSILAYKKEFEKSKDVKAANELIVSKINNEPCLLYTSPSPRDQRGSRMPSSA